MKSLFYILFFIFCITSAEASHAPEKEAEPVNPAPKTGYYEIETPFITNLTSTGNKLNYIKVQVLIVLSDSRDIPLLEEHEATVKNLIVKILGEETYATASAVGGRDKILEKCKNQITETTDKIVGRRIVKNVMFTSFFIQ